MVKKARKRAKELIKTGVILGVGSTVVHKVGGPTAGVSKFAGYIPTMGSLAGAERVIRGTRNMAKKRKRKR